MKDLFKRTMTDIEMYSEILKKLAKHAIELGLDEEDLTVQRVHLKTDAALKKYLKLTKEVKELGYTSLPLAIKALSQMKDRVAHDLNLVHEDFHKLPNVWLTGKQKSKNNAGFVGLTLSVALRRHRCMLPLIVEAWQLIADDVDEQQELLWLYQRVSSDEFEKALYRYIYALEEVPLEEEFTQVLDNEETMQKVYDYTFDPNRIYGVTNESMPEVSWDDEDSVAK